LAVRVLVDTHLLLWAVASSRRLPKEARSLILDAANEVFYSAASVWGAIKSALRRRDLRADPTVLVRALAQSGFSELPVTAAHAARVAGLPAIHRDPFDRLLVAQSLAEPMTLLTNDAALVGYGPLVRLV
jgi:PIN domain nuclease of toxin-antitoxin system